MNTERYEELKEILTGRVILGGAETLSELEQILEEFEAEEHELNRFIPWYF